MRFRLHPDEKVAAAEPAENGSELAWLSQHSEELERNYRGEWLLLNGAELASHSPNFSEIQRQIAKLHLQSPFVYFVPERNSGDFIA